MYIFSKYSVKKNHEQVYVSIEKKEPRLMHIESVTGSYDVLTRFKMIFLYFDLYTGTGMYNYIKLNHYYPRNHPAATLYLIEAGNRAITRSCGQ